MGEPIYIEVNETLRVVGEGTIDLKAVLTARIHVGTRRGKGFTLVADDWPGVLDQLRMWDDVGRPRSFAEAQQHTEE